MTHRDERGNERGGIGCGYSMKGFVCLYESMVIELVVGRARWRMR